YYNEDMSIAGSFLLNREVDGVLVESSNVQEFEGLDFKIKTETLPTEDNNTRLLFLDKNDKEIPVPEDIECKDVTSKKEVIKKPLPHTQYFLITHPLKYEIYHNNKCIYKITGEKKFSIFNYQKPEE
ncbi:2040_t:CDS:1, partial [Diversispora eburnea]